MRRIRSHKGTLEVSSIDQPGIPFERSVTNSNSYNENKIERRKGGIVFLDVNDTTKIVPSAGWAFFSV